jgi:hypothetical protein
MPELQKRRGFPEGVTALGNFSRVFPKGSRSVVVSPQSLEGVTRFLPGVVLIVSFELAFSKRARRSGIPEF